MLNSLFSISVSQRSPCFLSVQSFIKITVKMIWLSRSAVNHSPRSLVGSTGLTPMVSSGWPHLICRRGLSWWKQFQIGKRSLSRYSSRKKKDTFWPRQEFIRNLRDKRKDMWVCCWTSTFWLCWKFAEGVGWRTAPLGERCRNSASQCQSFGFACATTASPARSAHPWGQLEGWGSHRGNSMSGSVTFLNVQTRAYTLQL